MRSEVESKALIFVHMFRSGGSTLNRIMDWEYSPQRIFSVNGRYCRWGYRKLTEIPSPVLARMQVFRGHMPVGLHKFLPQPSTYITLLRDPVKRILSEYFAGFTRLSHRQHRVIKELSVPQFVSTLANNNAQTKMIAGLSNSYDFLAEECTEQTLAAAKTNLCERFSLVGITEQFESTLALAKCILGWNVPRYTSFNSTRKPAMAISPETRRFIAEHNRFDVELYQYAVGLFNEALARHAEEISGTADAVRRARLAGGSRLFYYRTASTALKLLGLTTSTALSMMSARRSSFA